MSVRCRAGHAHRLGLCALTLAVASGSMDAVALLVSRGAVIQLPLPRYGRMERARH